MTTKIHSKRFQWIKNTIIDQLQVSDSAWTDCIGFDKNREMFQNFLDGVGPPKILVYYQLPDQQTEDSGHQPVLIINYGDTIKIKNRAIYFMRNLSENKKSVNLNEQNDSEVIWGELLPNPIKIISILMESVYEPIINSEKYDSEWGLADKQSQQEFANYTQKFKKEVDEALNLMCPSKELFKLDQSQNQRLSKLPEDEKINQYKRIFQEWIQKTQEMLTNDIQQKKEDNDVGPRYQLQYWRNRMQRITNWSEQLKSKDFMMVKNALIRSKHNSQSKKDGQQTINKLIMAFNRLDLNLTDKLNEAKDNVKYLSTLEKFMEPLYTGTPQQIIETLPALMNAIKMIHTIARFYNTTDKMTGLFVKITNQMIKNCKEKIIPGGTDKTWDIWKKKPPEQMIILLTSCIKLHKEYKDIYKQTKQKVADMPKGKTFDFPQNQIFNKFQTFVKRLRKIIDIFENIQQFNALNKHNLEGMEALTAKFNAILEEFKKKRTVDLLNLQKPDFDRDYVQFTVDISKLDTQMQTFINSHFSKFQNIEYSLKLLKKFENTLKRDALRHNLEQKYSTILYNYSTELDSISNVFQESRNDPPIVRNVPQTAGKIIWSRHLFQKITGPINLFPKSIVGNSEIKRYYSSYNSLGKQLTIHQMWYFMIWSNDIQLSKGALQATLIVKNDKKLFVNFHPNIMQLIREAKCLDRQNIKIPESARIILLQQQKFKMYNNELLFLLKQYDRIINKIKPICKDLLTPHIHDLELKILPGMSTLTWTSMNIDSFLSHVHHGLSRLEQLIINVNDIIENRIESNLKLISKVILVSLPEGDKTFSLQNFVNMQETYINQKRSMMTAKNIQIQKAVDDLIKAILVYQLDPRLNEKVKSEDTKKLQKYYFWYLYQSLLNATQNSLNAMKHRICGSKGSSNQKLHPFFEVDVQLEGLEVRLNPSLQMIQKAINKAATTVLRCSKTLYNWNKQEILQGKKTSLYDMIAQDKEIVKVILLLTGSIQGTKNKVNDFLSKFTKYEWIWKQSVLKTLKQFQDEAQLQSYQVKLKQFTNIESQIQKIEPTFVIGAMVLKTANLCTSMKQHCKQWKYHYSEDLHQKAKAQLQRLTEQIKDIKEKLIKTKVKDIDSLGIVMEKLQEIRNMQTVIDIKFNPVLQMYSLLDSYLPPGNIDKDQMDHRSMLRRNWDSLVLQSQQISNSLSIQQADYLKKLKHNVKQLVKDVIEFRSDYEKNGPMVQGIEPKQALERLKRFIEQYEVRQQQYKINAKGEDLFGLQNQKYQALQKTKAQLNNLRKLYDLYMEVLSFISQFEECAWQDITPAKLIEKDQSAKRYKQACQNLPKDLKQWQAYKVLKGSIDNMTNLLPIINLLKKESIQPRHWQALIQKTGYKIPYEAPESFLIEELIKAKVLDYQDDIQEIAQSAQKQKKIKITKDEMKLRWDQMSFEFANWYRRENSILKGTHVQELSQMLEEDQMTLSSINAQRHVAPFKKQVEEMIRSFSDCSQIIDLWVKVQKLWTSLQPVFTGGDIAKQMPVQAKIFIGIDKTWIRCMEKAFETKKVLLCCQSEMLKESLPDMQKKLQECQKMLQAYLQGKRKQFPRFYFVSNPNLLKILSMGSQPNSIQQDFQKLFDAITRVEFGKDTQKKGSTTKVIKTIIQELGNDQQLVNLKSNVRCQGNIQFWLNRLEIQMQATIRYLGSLASVQCSQVPLGDGREQIKLYDNKLAQMLKMQISQISLMSIQIIWTTKMTQIFEQKDKQGRGEGTKKSFVQYISNVLTQMCLQDIEKAVQRKKIQTLVTIHVHQKEITESLKTTISENDFDWQKQTRLYWRPLIDHCVVCITDFEQNYTYEFLGAKERLCVTSLTDRCYITLAQALSMFYGGAPAGPAGTGKTETVKDLGRTLGIFVVVTNCSDQHRYRDMAKIFKGLVQSGLWGCFDQFNRIDLEVLSVVAMQVQSIGLAKKQSASMFNFPEEPNQIKIQLSVGYFITMNPGYAGRQELPENLKVLFRGVTMMVPDREVIIKVKLASVGYSSINSLAKKFNILYKLCQEQLSKQRHYDFGLRNILSVLRTAGNTKRAESKLFDNAGDKADSIQEKLLMRSLRDMNQSKLVEDDQPLFADLLLDIFPKQTQVQRRVYKDIQTGVPQVIGRKCELVLNSLFIKKIIQLYETSLVRHGFMLVGVTGTGKTTIMNILTQVLTDISKPYKIMRMNPKAITDKEMYGVKSQISDDWIPGVFSTLWLRANNRANKFVTWITCDGPVDAIWIQNLNTVLDDNKILTLANGQRIPMIDQCKLVFQVQNLNNASPATVSRCGQVFISPGDLPPFCLFQGWCNMRKAEKTQEQEANILLKIFNKYFVQLDIIRNISKAIKSPPVMNIQPPIKVSNTINLVNGILKPLTQGKMLPEKDYQKIVVYAFSWAIGGLYQTNQRFQFNEYLQSIGAPTPAFKKQKQTIFDYFISIGQSKAEYQSIEPIKWRPPEKGNIKFSQLFLPTHDSQRADLLIRNILKQPKPVHSQTAFFINAVLLVGSSGTAKTTSVLLFSNSFDIKEQTFKRINFSSATTPFNFQTVIEAQCDSKVGKNFAPPGGKLMTIFIDDMSMPLVNKWGDQITLQIVRQLIEQGGFYWLDKAQRGNFKNIKGLSFIGAMNHPGGGRNDIPNRLKRQHFIFNMILPLSIEVIYGPIIKQHFRTQKHNSGLTEQVKRVIQNLTGCTIKLWQLVKKYMLPTPSKFHYVFNMRELSRIIKGILQIKRQSIMKTQRLQGIKPQVYMIALWRHECQRVFVDKLTNMKEKLQVQNYIEDILTHNFNLQAEVNKQLKGKYIYYLDFMATDTRDQQNIITEYGAREYEAVAKIQDIRKRCVLAVDDYNNDTGSKAGKKLQLVLFDDAIQHLLRISRIIKMPRSSALLVGVGGSGKQSLTRLAAYIGRMQTRQIILAKNYGEKQLREDIKEYFKQAGHLGKQTCFILTDSQVKKEEFLQYINMILSTGQIAGLFAKDQREVIMADVRNDFIKEKNDKNAQPTAGQLYSFFVQRTRDNLHVVLCFSPVGQKFRDRSRKFPALFNQCTIDWFLTWPQEALVSVAETDIRKFKQLQATEQIKLELMKHMGNVHVIVRDICDQYFTKMRRQVYVTPKSYLSYLKSYVILYKKKFMELDKTQQNFSVGVKKIDEAAESIAIMKVSLKEEEAQLKEATLKCQNILNNLHAEQHKAQLKQREVAITASSCQKQAQEIMQATAQAQKDLQAALPAMESAKQAVQSLDNKMINQVKNLRKTPPIIEIIMDAVCILFQAKMNPVSILQSVQIVSGITSNIIKPSFQDSGKNVLFDMNFLKNLKSFDKNAINNQTIELLEPMLHSNYFDESVAGKATVAGKSILKWVKAVCQYHQKSQIVKPKQVKLVQEQARLQIAKDELASARAQLKTITDYLSQLDQNSNRQINNKLQLEQKSMKTKKKINTAETLITNLGDQKQRWKNGASEIHQEKKKLVGNCSLATAFISYCGPFNSDFRTLLSQKFIQDMKSRKVPVKQNLVNQLTAFLVDDATVGQWNLQGLPKDDLSIQNGIMVTNSTRYPLLIDPQGQGQAWIVKKYAESIEKNRSICTINNPKFKQNYLKYCIEEGKTLIIQGVENEIDPMMDPVLEKQVIYKKKGNGLIEVGGQQLQYNNNFLLFLTCRLSNPSFSPQLSAKATVIDFAVTQKGLEQQLLGKVISKEQKALQDSLNQLLADVNFNKKQLQKLDRDLLQRLSESTGNLLDDKDLMDVLNNTKSQSKQVTIKLKDSQIKTSQINQKRQQYRPVAVRGAAIYFTMIEVSLVNWMYNSSLEQFLNLFNESIENSDKAQNPSKRVQNIIKHLTKNIYRYVNRGLFEKDKITYILMICFKILITAGKISNNDVGLFLKAGGAQDIKSKPKPTGTNLDWLIGNEGDKIWLNLVAFSKHCFNQGMAIFKDLPDMIQKNPNGWKLYFNQNEPQSLSIPDINDKILLEKEEIRAFIKMCLIRSIRQDRTIMAANGFINTILGQQYTKPISYPIDSIWLQSSPYTPVLFLLSAGADPTSSIDQFARKKKKFPVDKVSMGEGQEIIAKKTISNKLQDGGWVVLQNCHLGLKFMEEIDQMITNWIQSQSVKPHPQFRLWITCEQHPKFPLGLLQKTIKVTNQPPKGVKAGLYKTFTTIINQEFIDKVDHLFWKNIMFTLCFMHSILIQRRKFGPLGWCIPYEFNNSDLEASLYFVQKYLTNLISINNSTSLAVSNTVLRYMVCEVQYGGRVTDDLDRELLISFGQKYLVEPEYNSGTSQFTLADTPKFKYKIPYNQNSQLSKYLSYISELPGSDSPEIFGLHPNADLTFRKKQSEEMIQTIKETRPKEGGAGGGKTREQVVKDKCKQMLVKLPGDYIQQEVRQSIKKMVGPKSLGSGMSVPLNIFLFQEIQNMQRVIGIVRKTLHDAIDAIDGQIIMTPDILDAINSIFEAKVPTQWIYDPTGAQISWIFQNLGTWNTNLYQRNSELYKWLSSGKRPDLFWLGGFFNPQGFITAVKQQVTRIHKVPQGRTGTGAGSNESWSLDEVIIRNTVKDRDSDKEPVVDGVFIRGLHLQGCSFRLLAGQGGFTLDDSKPRKLFQQFPTLLMQAFDNRSKDKQGMRQVEDRSQTQYICPVYKYKRRTDKYLITRVNLSCQSTATTRWRQRGVALLCATD